MESLYSRSHLVGSIIASHHSATVLFQDERAIGASLGPRLVRSGSLIEQHGMASATSAGAFAGDAMHCVRAVRGVPSIFDGPSPCPGHAPVARCPG